MTGRKWRLLTVVFSKVKNTQMELEPCHRGWWVEALIYVPYRWCAALCHLCAAGGDKNNRHHCELFCRCVAETLLSGLSRNLCCVQSNVTQQTTTTTTTTTLAHCLQGFCLFLQGSSNNNAGIQSCSFWNWKLKSWNNEGLNVLVGDSYRNNRLWITGCFYKVLPIFAQVVMLMKAVRKIKETPL